MIWNIIDQRKRPYRWKFISAIVENAAHDNACEDSDEVLPEHGTPGPTYEEKRGTSVSEAVAWAQDMEGLVTLYIYDGVEGLKT